MTKRPAITERMKVRALILRFGAQCARCGRAVLPYDEIEWDHSHPLGLGGPHHFSNIAPLHKDCHRIKTSGSGATTAGSDIGNISKVKRLIRKREGTWRKSAKVWPKRKMQSRPFEKRRPEA